MLETTSAAVGLYLISFLRAIPGYGHAARGAHPSWFLLLAGMLGIFSRSQSLCDLEWFAKRHQSTGKGGKSRVYSGFQGRKL